MALADPAQRATALAVLRWQRLRAPHLRFQDPLIPSDADADHSALLERLLAGGEPFLVPPPTSHSYPWYDLVERGWALAGCERWGDLPIEPELAPDQLLFQQSLWQIDSRYSAREHPAWAIHHEHGWQAIVEWEEGPFVVGRAFAPVPHDILEPAYVVRLLGLAAQSEA